MRKQFDGKSKIDIIPLSEKQTQFRNHYPLNTMLKLENIIGQKAIVQFLQNAVNSARNGGIIPSVAFDAEAGKGKTHCMEAYKNELVEAMGLEEHQILVYPSPAQLRNKESSEYLAFVAAISSGEPYVLLLDEVHELNEKVTVSLQKINRFIRFVLDKTNEGKSLQYDDDTIVRFNNKENVIICGSNFLYKMGSAFTSRSNVLQLQDYTEKEIAQILVMKASAKGIELEPKAIERVSRAGRGNVRFLDRLMEQLEMHAMVDSTPVNEETMLHIMKLRGLYPRGLNEHELRIMGTLKEVGAGQIYSVQQLKVVLNLPAKTFSDCFAFLASPFNSFIQPIGQNVKLTKKGHSYLSRCAQYGFID